MKKEDISNEVDLRPIIRELFIVYDPGSFNNVRLNYICSSAPKEIESVSSAFIANISGCVSTISLPFTMALASATKILYDRLLTIEIISHYILHGKRLSNAEAKERAEKRHGPIHTSEESIEATGKEFCSFLFNLHKNKEMAEAAAELLRQGTVLIWGALETLSRDIFETIINARPLLGKQLIDSPDSRKVYQIRSIDTDTLAKFDFDISRKMGTILVQHQDFSNLAAIKSTFDALFPENEPLRSALSSRQIWIMNQRRHLIVHKRGVVDQRYIDNTGDVIPIGERILIRPEELKDYVLLIQEVGAELIDAIKTICR